MASYSPPTENLAIFDSSVFLTGDEPLTYNQAVKKFLKYPTAQGTENLLTTNVNGILTANDEVFVNDKLTLSPATTIVWDQVDQSYLINRSSTKSGTGDNNVCLGWSALESLTTGSNNCCVGTDAGQAIDTGSRNCIFGDLAGQTIQSGSGNCIYGSSGLKILVAGDQNVVVGTDAATYTTASDRSVTIGYLANNQVTDTTYDDSVAIGSYASNNNFSNSVAIGTNSLNTSANQVRLGTATETVSCPGTLTFKMTSDNSSGTYYIPFSKTTAGTEGRLFIDDTTGPLTYDPSTASMSMGILNLTSGGVTTTYRNNCINTVPASPNIFFSTRTTAPSSGTNNVVMGSNAGTALSSGNNNVILGLNSGSAFTSASSNVAVGAGALQSIVTGAENVAIGQGSMGIGIGAGGRNVCVGHQSGQSITSTTNGQNVCIGYTAGKSITTGSNVTSVGANANTTGNTTLTNSTAIGANATNANFNSSTAIGANATNTSANQIILGTASETVSCPGSLTFKMTSDNSSGTYYIPFSKTTAGTEGGLFIDDTTGPLSYDPSTATLFCTTTQVTNVNATAVGTAVNLFTNSTTGNISIGTGLTSGDILIGPQSSGSPTADVVIMPRGGWAGTFQVGGNSASAKLLCATNLEVNYPISTAVSGTSGPSSARHLGYTVNQATTGWTTSLTSNTQTNITSVAFTSADYGTYLFEAKIQITPTDNTVSRQQILGISTSSANYGNNTDLQYTTANVGHPMLSVMRVLNIYANTTVYLVGYIAGTNGTVVTAGSAGIFSYTRIA